MSTKKTKITEALAQEMAQALKIFTECYNKRFSANATKMAEWFGNIQSQNIGQWLSGTAIPAAVILKITNRWPEIAAFVLEGKGEIKDEYPHVRDLHEKVDELLKNKFIANHLEAALGFYEAFDRQQQADKDRAHILRVAMTRRGVGEEAIAAVIEETARLLGHATGNSALTVHDPESAFGAAVPEKGESVKGGTPEHPGKGSAGSDPPRKK